MKPIFLTSSVHAVASHIGKVINPTATGDKLLFITTATEVGLGDKSWMEDDKQALAKTGFLITDFTLTNKSEDKVTKALSTVDAVYVEGGNTYYLLYQMQQSGFTKVIHQFVPEKITYIGTSAGSIVACPDIEVLALGDSPADAPELKDFQGLGFTDLSLLPHWGSAHFQRDFEKVLRVMYHDHPNKYVLLNDYQYLKITEEKTEFIDVRRD